MYQFSLDWFKDMFISCISNQTLTQGQTDLALLQDGQRAGRRKSSVAHLVGTLRPASRQGSVSSTPRPSIAEVLKETPAENPLELRKHMLEMITRWVWVVVKKMRVGNKVVVLAMILLK